MSSSGLSDDEQDRTNRGRLSRTLREMVSYVLQHRDFKPLQAGDRVEALRTADVFTCDLVVTDLDMPNMDGLTLIRELRTRRPLKFTQILMLTTELSPKKKQLGREAGATCWIVKPFSPDSLMRVVTKVAAGKVRRSEHGVASSMTTRSANDLWYPHRGDTRSLWDLTAFRPTVVLSD